MNLCRAVSGIIARSFRITTAPQNPKTFTNAGFITGILEIEFFDFYLKILFILSEFTKKIKTRTLDFTCNPSKRWHLSASLLVLSTGFFPVVVSLVAGREEVGINIHWISGNHDFV